MASRSGVYIGDAKFAGVKGVEALQRKIAALPDTLVQQIKPAIQAGAKDLAEQIKAVAPVSELTKDPGELRDSVVVLPGRTELSAIVSVDARDAHGRYIAAHVEYGHKDGHGGHVPAVPFVWPSYRVTRKKIRARVTRATTAAVKAAQAVGGTGDILS